MLNMRQDQRRINKRRRQEIVVIWKQSLEKLLDYSHGIIMGISAMLPTFTHLSMSVYSVITYLYSQYKFRARR